jgi:hypothetical protein
MDFFVGFLWLTECLVVFVSIIFLFYLNNPGNFNKLNLSLLRFFTLGGSLGLVSIIYNVSFFSEHECFIPYEMSFIDFWDDFYESLNNVILNDAVGLFISYYSINSFEFVLTGLFLLIGTLVVVNLNKFNKNIQQATYNNFLEIFHFFKN